MPRQCFGPINKGKETHLRLVWRSRVDHKARMYAPPPLLLPDSARYVAGDQPSPHLQ